MKMCIRDSCIGTNGHPFHGECPVAVCCQNKGFVHCGECPDIPCELLTQYSCDPEHGDTPVSYTHLDVYKRQEHALLIMLAIFKNYLLRGIKNASSTTYI